MVYFIQMGGHDGPIKIGWTDGNPLSRLSAIGTGNPHDLALIAIIPDAARSLEGQLHREFRNDRVRGEWFAASPRLLDYIARNGRPFKERFGSLPARRRGRRRVAAALSVPMPAPASPPIYRPPARAAKRRGSGDWDNYWEEREERERRGEPQTPTDRLLDVLTGMASFVQHASQ